MKNLRLMHLHSVKELRDHATEWDDLWWRSETALPTMRAELLAQWLEQFRPHAKFCALAVADAGRFVAAIPLIANHVGHVLPVGSLPNNPWAASGDLLLDNTADGDSALDLLTAAVADQPWPLLWFNEVLPETPHWQAFFRTAKNAEMAIDYHERYRVARIEIEPTWECFEKRISRNHLRAMRRLSRRLACEGNVQFERRSEWAADEIEPWLEEAFGVEDRSWKGAAGTSVLHTPGMLPFFTRQAKQLAQWGQLDTAALRLNDQMIAFIYGIRSKGVLFAYKISYDPRFAPFSPGQLLFNDLLEQMHRDGAVQTLDFLGPLMQSVSRWHPATYGVGRAVLAPDRWLSRAVFQAYRQWRRPFRRPAEPLPCPTSSTRPIDSPVPEPINLTR